MSYKLEQLYQINIHNLRNLAREIGVNAPTTLPKMVLIQEIMQIESGEKQPCIPSQRGRPPKNSAKAKNKRMESKASHTEKEEKKELIDKILREIEKKLYKLL